MDFSCQLAKTYSPTKNYAVNGWFSSPKLDGVRSLFIPGQGLFSRTLKTKYVGLEHIENVCSQMGTDIIDGELYIPIERFDTISGIVRKTKKYDVIQKSAVEFHVFAIFREWANTEEMIHAIREAIPDNQSSVVPVNYTFIENNAIAIFEQNQFNKIRFSPEGTMLRNPNIAYFQGRNEHLLKVKNFEKSVFTVMGFYKGSGKYSQSLGKLSIEGVVNNIGITAKVGTGFTDAERLQIWNNQAQFLNAQIEVIHAGITYKSSLRHPVFSRFIF